MSGTRRHEGTSLSGTKINKTLGIITWFIVIYAVYGVFSSLNNHALESTGKESPNSIHAKSDNFISFSS